MTTPSPLISHRYLAIAAVLAAAAVLVLVFDLDARRKLSVSGVLFTAAGAYLIGAGVVLRKCDFDRLKTAEFSGGPKFLGTDPQQQIITDMFRTQSRCAKWGIAAVLLGCALQIAGQYA